ncbi:MAG: double-strand break repair helicase AddA [Rhodospirillaceae bacterium]|nr:double-strand break repair helicase AddA [Rhodospirillaceae bacterium]
MSISPALSSADALQRRAADPAASVWVAASAGTGKTKVLTDRVLNLLIANTSPDSILCLTFTRAAAAEMAERIAHRLADWAVIGEKPLFDDLGKLLGRTPVQDEISRARKLFAQVLDVPGGMRIETVHAFCQGLLRRFPLEAGVPPHFNLLDERSASERLFDAREQVLAMARNGAQDGARDGGDPALAQALSEVTGRVAEQGFLELLGGAVRERARLARLSGGGGIEGAIAEIHKLLGAIQGESVEGLIAQECDDHRFDGSGLKQAVEVLSGGSKTDIGRGEVIAAWLASDRDGRLDSYPAYRQAFLTADGSPRKSLATKKLAEADPDMLVTLEQEAERLIRVEERRKAQDVAVATSALLRLVSAVVDTYESSKRRAALLDYEDLVLTARDLLRRPGVAPWVLFKLDGGLNHILIDEAQDTNPEQWQVVEALAEEFFAGEGADERNRTVFAVGDVKQSIYSFQRADPAGFLEMRRHFSGRVTAAERRWDRVDLDMSFRSTAPVLQAVDAVFNRPDAGDGVVESDDQGHPMPVHHEPHRVGQAGLVEVWPPFVPAEGLPREAWAPPVERIASDSPRRRLAEAIADRIASWVVEEEPLPSKGRAIRPGDVMILVRRRDALVEDLVRALKTREIAVAGVDRMVLTDQLAVMDLVALGQFLLLPEDDLTLATVLKGPLVGLSEDDLFDLANNRHAKRLWDELRRKAGDNAVLTGAHAYLGDLLARADRMPPYELFAEVLSSGGRRRILARLGPEASDPIDEFLAQAVAYERIHVPSLQGFLQWLAAGAFEIKRDLETGAPDQVRIMTVHGAKGLQAPIVFLPDTMQLPTRLDPLKWIETDAGEALPIWSPNAATDDPVSAAERGRLVRVRDREYRRLLYVAMTRAEDRLLVTGWHGARMPPEGNWYQLVRSAMTELGDEVDLPDISQVSLSQEPALVFAGRQEAEVERETERGQANPGRIELPGWASRPPLQEPHPPVPLAPSRPSEDEPAVASPLDQDGSARFKRGVLMHRLLELLPEIPEAKWEEACHKFLDRPVHDLSEQQKAAYSAEILEVLRESSFRRLFGPNSRAEVPIVGILGEGETATVVSGQIDRMVVEPERVTVVDFKTNRPPPGAPELVPTLYFRQMAAYRALLEQLYPGREVVCALLWTDGPNLMILPSDQIAASSYSG